MFIKHSAAQVSLDEMQSTILLWLLLIRMILSEARDASCQLWIVLLWPLSLRRGFAIETWPNCNSWSYRNLREQQGCQKNEWPEDAGVILRRIKEDFASSLLRPLILILFPPKIIRIFYYRSGLRIPGKCNDDGEDPTWSHQTQAISSVSNSFFGRILRQRIRKM